jgi:hypothetical protein
MRASRAPRGSRTFEPSGRSQASKPLASSPEQRTHPKVCGVPNTTFDVLTQRSIITHLPNLPISLPEDDEVSKVSECADLFDADGVAGSPRS